jgi:hypothetical protein
MASVNLSLQTVSGDIARLKRRRAPRGRDLHGLGELLLGKELVAFCFERVGHSVKLCEGMGIYRRRMKDMFAW